MSALATVTAVEAQCGPLPSTLFAGYDVDVVDDFLDDVAQTLRDVAAGQPATLTPQDVVKVKLPRVRLGQVGYARRHVDELLDRVADTLAAAA